MIAITAIIALIFEHLPTFRAYHAPKTYRLLSYIMFLFFAWDIASLIAYDYIARTRLGKISAFAGDVQLPDSAIAAQAQLLGVSAEYWSNDFGEIFIYPSGSSILLFVRKNSQMYLFSVVQWMAIVPWFAVLFGLVSGIELFLASNRAAEEAPSTTHTHFVHDAPYASKAGSSVKTDAEEEKGEVKVRDGAEV